MLKLYFNQTWGSVRTESRSFDVKDRVISAGPSVEARFPLFGFQLPAESYPIAEWAGTSVRLFPPPAARVERSSSGTGFDEVAADQLTADGNRRFLTMTPGTTVRMREGDQLLTVTLDEQKDRAGWEKQKAVFWLAFLVLATVGAPLIFLTVGPAPGLVDRALQDARVKQGLPAVPEPLDIRVPDADESDAEQPNRGKVIPASVR